MSPQDTILNRVKKLLNLTEAKGATPEEAAAAAAKAQSLLFEHNLSMSQVETHELDAPTESYENVDVVLDANTRTVTWKRSLLHAVARYNFCSAVSHGGTTRMNVIGKRSNVAVVEYLAATVGAEIERLAKEAGKTVLYSRPSFVSSFSLGAVATIRQRLYEQAQANETASAACTALVVQSKGALQAALSGFYPRLGKSRSGRIGNYAAYQAGRAAGHGIGLNRGIGSGSSTRQIR